MLGVTVGSGSGALLHSLKNDFQSPELCQMRQDGQRGRPHVASKEHLREAVDLLTTFSLLTKPQSHSG